MSRVAPVITIDGPSGAGKSSFARAGLVPAVRAGVASERRRASEG